MADLALHQLKDVLDAYAERDADKALEVWRRDEKSTRCKFDVPRATDLYDGGSAQHRFCDPSLFGAKNIERVGDHTTNIAETIHYLVRGSNIADDRPKDDQTPSMSRPDRMPSSSPVPDADLERYARLLHAQRPPMLRGLGWALAGNRPLRVLSQGFRKSISAGW